MRRKYNTQKGLPLLAIAKLPTGTHDLKLTRHVVEKAELAAKKFKLAQTLSIPTSLNFDGATVFEIEAEKGKILKVVCRLPYDEKHDISLAIDTQNKIKKLITVWLNMKSDDHPTLKKDDIADPSEFDLDIE